MVKLDRIGQIAVRVHDLDAAVTFYRDTLGMPFLFRVERMAFFQLGAVRLMLGLPERAEHNHPASVIYYQVDDIQATHAELQARGVPCNSPPHLIARLPDREVWMAFFSDPSDNLLAIMSEPPLT